MSQDEFTTIKLKLAETTNMVSKAQEERDNALAKNGTRTMLVIKRGIEIQDGLNDLDLQIQQMREVLRRQRKNSHKFPESEIALREQQYHEYENLIRKLRRKEEGDSLEEEKPITLDDMKIRLTGNRGPNRMDVNRELNQNERDAMQQFDKGDRELNAMADDVISGLGMLKTKAQVMGDDIENQGHAIKDLDTGVNLVNNDLTTQGKKLKRINEQYRTPPRWCLRAFCFLILVVLIVVVIVMATKL